MNHIKKSLFILSTTLLFMSGCNGCNDSVLDTICSSQPKQPVLCEKTTKEFIYLTPVSKELPKYKNTCPPLKQQRPPSICYGDMCPFLEYRRMPGICYGSACPPLLYNP